MLQYSLDNLLGAFDDVDGQGALQLIMPEHYLYPPETKGRENIARQLIETFFNGQQLVLVRLNLVKSFVKEVLLDLGQTDKGHWVVKLDFAKLMLLPCVDRTQELTELRKLFEELKSLVALDASRLGTAQVCNEKTGSGKVYGSIRFHFRETQNTVAGPDRTVEANARLTALVQGSTLVQEYLRQVALALGKLGPYSWATVGEDQLYGQQQGPWAKAFSARYLAEKQEAAAAAKDKGLGDQAESDMLPVPA